MHRERNRILGRRRGRLLFKSAILATGLLLLPFSTGCLKKILGSFTGGNTGAAANNPLSGFPNTSQPPLTTASSNGSGTTSSTSNGSGTSTGTGSGIGPAAPGDQNPDGLPGQDQVGQLDGDILQKLDIPYGNQHERQKLDLYLPKDGGPHPLVLFLHGGGFVGGDKSQARGFDEFVRQGYALASVNYTLGDKSAGTNPLKMRDVLVQAVGDVRQAVRYLRSSAGEHGLDARRFAVFGVSAGGYYAAMLGAVGDRNVPEFDRGRGSGSAAVQAVVEYAGPTDFLSYPGGNLGQLASLPGVADTVAGTLPPSVLPYVGGSHPPTRIIHGSSDTVVPIAQSEQYHQALRQAGVQAEFETLQGAGHSLPDNQKQQQIEKAIAFVKKTLG